MMAGNLKYTNFMILYMQGYTEKNSISCKKWVDMDTKDDPFMINTITGNIAPLALGCPAQTDQYH